MMDFFKDVKAKVAQNNETMGTSSTNSLNNGFSQRIAHVADNVNASASLFTTVYGDVKASAEAEVAEINARLKKQQKTQAIFGVLTTAASLAPQAMSLLSSIKACKSASTDTKTTPQQKQNQVQEYTQKLAEAEKQVETYETEIATLNSDIEKANKTITEQGEVSKTKQKEIDDATDAITKQKEVSETKQKEIETAKAEKDALTKSKDDETDATLVSLNSEIEKQKANKANGESDLAKANAMPDTIKQQKVVNGQVQYVDVENTAKKQAKAAAEKKIKEAEEEIKKLETQKTERKAEIDKQIAAKQEEIEAAEQAKKEADEAISAKEEEKKAAVNAKREADEAVASAEEEIKEKKASADEKTKAKDRLEKTEIPQLKAALEELKKAAGVSTTQSKQVTQDDETKKKQV